MHDAHILAVQSILSMPAEFDPYDIFADESCQTAHKFMVLGCVIAHSEEVPRLRYDLQFISEHHDHWGEMKWGKIRKRSYLCYRDLVDEFSFAARERRIHFHSIVIDT